jgi:hypothetical protein
MTLSERSPLNRPRDSEAEEYGLKQEFKFVPRIAELHTGEPRLVRALGIVALLVLLAGYSVALSRWYVPAITHPDSNGYWAQGSLIASTGSSVLVPENRAQYIGMHWLLVEKPEGQDQSAEVYAARYPPGLAVVVGPIWKYFGWRASTLVNPVLAVLTVAGVFFVVRNLTGSSIFGVAAAALLTINQGFTEHAFTDIAHMPVAFLLVWGFAFLLWWSGTGSLVLAFFAGIILGCIPSVRYPDAIIAIGVAAFMLAHVRKFPKIWTHYTAALVGALIPVLPLLIRNHMVFGKFWKTGYALTNEQTGFAWDYFWLHWNGYLQLMHGGGVGILFGLGLIGMIWMVFVSRFRAAGLLLLFSAAPFLLLYMFYYWPEGGFGRMGGGVAGMGIGGGLRFVIPMVPLFIIAGAWTLGEAMKRAPVGAKLAVPVAIIAMHLLMYGLDYNNQMERSRQNKIPLAVATEALEEVVPEGAVVIANNGLLQHLDFVRKWKLAEPSVVNSRGMFGMGMMRRGNDPDAPSPQQQAKSEARAQLYTGSTAERQQQFRDDLVNWSGDKGVYVIGTEQMVYNLVPGVPQDRIEIVKRFRIPEEPSLPQDVPMMTPGPGGPGPGGPGAGGPGGPNMQGPGGQGPGDFQRGPDDRRPMPGGPGAQPQGPNNQPGRFDSRNQPPQQQRRGGGGGFMGPGFRAGDEILIGKVNLVVERPPQ